MNKYSTILGIVLCIIGLSRIDAQENQIKSATDTLAPLVKEAQADLKKLKKIKISGYFQGQYQKAQSKGIASFSGDDFASGIDQRFSLRRGRLKTAYTGKLSEAAVQFDFTVEKGVNIKEAYLKVTEPLLKTVSLQTGVFLRPFGFELGLSNIIMEAPERARVTQTIFAGETDLGACLVFQPPQGPLNAFRLDAGLFSGSNIKVDFDNVKDFIGRLSYNKTLAGKYLTVGAGISYYNGGLWNFARNYYKWKDTVYVSNVVDSLYTVSRQYMGADAQITLNNSFGQTILRAELVWGTQPSASDKSKTPLEAYTKPLYVRDFSGGYLYFVQAIAKTKHQVVVKYDWYDPNTAINNDMIGITATNRTSKADIAYATLGFGWIYNWDENIKITAYYDVVKNEKTQLKGYTGDIKDNVFTIRIQYKF